MRVLWTHNFDPGVANKGVFVYTAAAGLRARGVEVELEFLGNLRSLRQLQRARKQVRRIARDFDLVHAQFGSACALATSAADGVPKVLTIRGSDWNVHSASRGFLYIHTRIAARLTRRSIGSYDCVLPVSQRIAAELTGLAPGASVTVLPSPIDLTRFMPRDKDEAKALLGFPNCREKWVLFNSLDLDNPIKRFELARRAFDLASARHGGLRLRLATGLEHEAMPLFVAACDAILCTSDNEGWPNSVKEALACNVPFIATDVSDLAEIARIEPSCRVCPAEPQAIADNICEMLAGPEPDDLRRHVQDMSVERVSERLVAAYQALLSRDVKGRKGILEC